MTTLEEIIHGDSFKNAMGEMVCGNDEVRHMIINDTLLCEHCGGLATIGCIIEEVKKVFAHAEKDLERMTAAAKNSDLWGKEEHITAIHRVSSVLGTAATFTAACAAFAALVEVLIERDKLPIPSD